MKNKTYLFNGKSVDLWGDDPTGWTFLSGDESLKTDAVYFKFIPTLYRAVQLRAYSVASMPFEILKGKTVYDESSEWQNKVGFIPNPFMLLQLIESALVIAGSCYLFRERSVATTKALHYHLPASVTPEINKITGKIEYFKRPVNGVEKHFTPEDYVYFWLPDPYIEVGPAVNYPAKAAANACGVLLNTDIFASNFFERGAIKAMLLTVTGMPSEAERQKLSDWWRRVVGGIKNAFGAQVINAEAVKPVVVGEGMKELENVTIGQEKREDVAIAMGIPMSILFANAANYATSQQDELNFLNKTIIPDCQFIESILNEQVFEALGLRLNFLPETLDAMQEDENDRAAALKVYTDAGFPLLMACDILGIELDDKQRAELEAAETERKLKAEELANRLENALKPKEEQSQQEEEQPQEENTTFKSEMLKWQRKAINAMKKGKPANVTFDTTIIPESMCETIMTALGNAKNEADVKDIFSQTTTPKVEFSDSIMVLATELRRANDLLEREE
jgi:HK97 family phage portal protein